jgi:uncharacterized protein
MPKAERVFLTAEWRDLVMLNYEVNPRLLQAFVPHGTTLDSFDGRTYVSLVAFHFCCTRLGGVVAVPFHSNFEEINLRFYVRHADGEENRRGVVFIAEIVPRRAIAAIARIMYGENYVSAPMKRQITEDEAGACRTFQYKWLRNSELCELWAKVSGPPQPPQQGSLEQFITEHYWGYSAQPDGGTVEYHVAHPPWRTWTCAAARFKGDPGALYGNELGRIVQGLPSSAFIAEGSPVTVFRGCRIR